MPSTLPPADDALVVTGLGHVILEASETSCDARAFLRDRKSRKYMGLQDMLAVAAAGRALAAAGLAPEVLGERAGLYLAVGYLPFERHDIEELRQGSCEDGRFSMSRFSEVAYGSVNPLLTFRCLSNMPAYHVSVNFDLQGPYFVGYPGPGQLYLALEAAAAALRSREVGVALVGGVAYQRNFLVERHFLRLVEADPAQELADAAGFLVLERREDAAGRRATARLRLESLEVGYRPHDPFEDRRGLTEVFRADDRSITPPHAFGAASLPALLSREQGDGARFRHELHSRDGFHAQSGWGAP